MDNVYYKCKDCKHTGKGYYFHPCLYCVRNLNVFTTDNYESEKELNINGLNFNFTRKE